MFSIDLLSLSPALRMDMNCRRDMATHDIDASCTPKAQITLDHLEDSHTTACYTYARPVDMRALIPQLFDLQQEQELDEDDEQELEHELVQPF